MVGPLTSEQINLSCGNSIIIARTWTMITYRATGAFAIVQETYLQIYTVVCGSNLSSAPRYFHKKCVERLLRPLPYIKYIKVSPDWICAIFGRSQ